MATEIQERDRTGELIHHIVKDAIHVAMMSPLREPILEAIEATGDVTIVEETDAGDESSGDSGSGRGGRILRGMIALGFVLGVLYLAFRRGIDGDGS